MAPKISGIMTIRPIVPERPESQFFTIETKNRFLFIPVLSGIVGGLLAVSLPLFLNVILTQGFWTMVLHYNDIVFKDIPVYQNACLFVFGSLIIGMFSCRLRGPLIRNKKDAIITGLLSGTFSYLALVGLISGSSLLIPFTTSSEIFTRSGFLFTEFISIPLLIFFSIGIQIIGAYTYHFQKTATAGPVVAMRNSSLGRWISRNPLFFPSMVFILIIFGPIGVVYTEMRMDLVDPEYFSAENLNAAFADRQNIDTITITLQMGSYGKNFERKNPFIDINPDLEKPQIFMSYNSLDLSTQSVIDSQGLNVSINPPQGLEYEEDSQATLKGTVISDDYGKGHLVVTDYNPSRGTRLTNITMIDMMI